MILYYLALCGAAAYAGCYGVYCARKRRPGAAAGAFLLPPMLLALLALLVKAHAAG